LVFSRGDPLFDAIHKMHGTARLNPYEREVLYGYPYVVGRTREKKVRGPLLTLAVEITAAGDHLDVQPADEVVRFNSLPFRTETDTEAHNDSLSRILEQTPTLPLTIEALRAFVGVVSRELSDLRIEAALDGSLAAPPAEPRGVEPLRMIDQAALFVAPKTSYFLRSDLDEIAAAAEDAVGALGPLVAGAGDEAQVDISDEEVDRARIVFPFPSNRAQRRVALVLDDESTHVVRVEGPPGTGKSLTIANLACHLAATGKRVLITSQKDKALEVVDEKLRELNLPELPMTLLRYDRDSKGELLGRLDRVEKRRSRGEVEAHYSSLEQRLEGEVTHQLEDVDAYASALGWESELEKADREFQAARRLRRLSAGWHVRSVMRGARRHAPEATDEVAERVSERREELLRLSLGVLQVGLERGVAGAKRDERRVIDELQSVLRRDQHAHRNFSIFDRMKDNLDQAQKLLRILPVWILSPDDVARLFPCEPGLFDLVIVDEASQVDLPSIVPIAYRAKKLAIFGDTKQMQSQRFAFMSQLVALEAWQQFGMQTFDPDEHLHPFRQSLLNLAKIRAEEEILLNEHFRSLPPIIDFSNRRWYGERLRIMTDVHQKAFGAPDQPIIELHEVPGGTVSEGTQENELEAAALVEHLAKMVEDPDYAGASIGILCLFEQQEALVNELVTDAIDPAEWDDHSLVVVNPDGFQGDERDVILYSLSWDNKVMPRAALSARQMDTAHIQGMLNVAFTRARDEIHVFHSAPVDTFGMAGDRPGALGEWMAHCAAVQEDGGARVSRRHGKVDSQFEADVAEALRASGVDVRHQYPASGFSIDLVCELNGERVAVECDGELYHLDEHGNLRIEDLERQAALERAGWYVLRIPYRKWLKEPEAQVARVLEALQPVADDYEEDEEPDETEGPGQVVASVAPAKGRQKVQRVTREQATLVEGLRTGLRTEEDLLRFARDRLGHQRLGPRIRESLLLGARQLNDAGLLVIEDGEYFLTPDGRNAELRVLAAPEIRRTSPRSARSRPRRRSGYGSYRYRRW
jgi:very-short-patch-repair endonuclease